MTDPIGDRSVTLNLGDACRQLNISESLGRQLERRGQFPGAFRLGGRVLVHRQIFLEELERLGRGQPLDERDPDKLLARAMGDAHARLVAFGSGRRQRSS
jgi:hypothetical protein